jgi:hypothetical protein
MWMATASGLGYRTMVDRHYLFNLSATLISRIVGKGLHRMPLANQAAEPDERVTELRRHPRRRVLHKALIVFNNGSCSIGCHIIDMSETGAKLVPADVFLCPREFVLKPHNGGPRYCTVMWRKDTQIGVRYV